MRIVLIIIMLSLFVANAAVAGGGGGAASSNYLPIDPPFVVNINNGNGHNFLQVNTELKLTDPTFAAMVNHHMAAIRHMMIMLLSSQTTEQVRTLEGKEQLREQALEAIQAVMQEETGDVGVEAVYFTGFVIQ